MHTNPMDGLSENVAPRMWNFKQTGKQKDLSISREGSWVTERARVSKQIETQLLSVKEDGDYSIPTFIQCRTE